MKICRYKTCGQILLVLNEGTSTQKCCDKDIELPTPKTTKSEAGEKHIPSINREGNSLKIKVGEKTPSHGCPLYPVDPSGNRRWISN